MAYTVDFVEAEIRADAANGKVQAYLAAHAEVYRQEFRDGDFLVRCRLPRYLVRHVVAEGSEVRLLEETATPRAASPEFQTNLTDADLP